MKQYNKLLTDIKWNPSRLCYIKSLIWDNSNLILVMYFQDRDKMSICPNFEFKFSKIKICFHNVSDFFFHPNSNSLHQLSGFDIVDMSDNELENVNYKILDYENDSIGFFLKKCFMK